MKKFDQVEHWVLETALENFRKSWKAEGAEAVKNGRNSLFSDNYIDMTVDGVMEKVTEGTLKKALKNIAQLKKEGKR